MLKKKLLSMNAVPLGTCLRRHLNFVRDSACLTLHGRLFHRMAPLFIYLPKNIQKQKNNSFRKYRNIKAT